MPTMNDSTPSELDFTPTDSAIAPSANGTELSPVGSDLSETELIRIELFEEVPTIHRETVVREKIQIRKISTSENS